MIIILAVVAMVFGNSIYITKTTSASTNAATGTELQNGVAQPFPAPDFKDISAWINSPPLHIQDLRGKVVLIDFWAYSCINCIRTLPYLIDWYSKYHKQGFEIIGVHSPEFDFERNLQNVQAAVKADKILYPVALDNSFATWQNYNNLYWPAHYLIDKNGDVVYEHFGEGEYNVTENNIRYLLGLGSAMPTALEAQKMTVTTPETYLGYERSQEFLSNENKSLDIAATYSYPAHLPLNAWALQGSWIIQGQKIISAQKGAAIKIHFTGKQVFAVMGCTKPPVHVQRKFNGVPASTIEVTEHKLYTFFSEPDATDGELELIADAPGLEIYTFTFG